MFCGANRGLGTREGDKWGDDYTITRIARVKRGTDDMFTRIVVRLACHAYSPVTRALFALSPSDTYTYKYKYIFPFLNLTFQLSFLLVLESLDSKYCNGPIQNGSLEPWSSGRGWQK